MYTCELKIIFVVCDSWCLFLINFALFRIRTHAIKFIEMLVLVQSLKSQVCLFITPYIFQGKIGQWIVPDQQIQIVYMYFLSRVPHTKLFPGNSHISFRANSLSSLLS